MIEARDVHGARNSYLELLQRRGIALVPSMAVYVETVHRSRGREGAWLCYVAQSVSAAAA